MTFNNSINIVFGVSKNYVPYVSVVIASILKHSNTDNFFKFYVLSFDSLKNELDPLVFSDYPNYKIFNLIADRSYISPSHTSPHVTIDGNLRLFIPLILHDLDRCIYLDADVLVNNDITALYNINLDNYYAGGVSDNTNNFERFLVAHNNIIIKKFRLKDDIYINSGVLLFNLKAIRQDHAENLLIYTAVKYAGESYVTLADQDFFNIAFNGKIKTIDPRWNVFVLRCYRPHVDCFILHYTSSHKPWNYPLIPSHLLYLEYAKISPYYETIKNDLLKRTDAYLASYKQHQFIFKLFNKFYYTLKLKSFRHYALKWHPTKIQMAIELRDFLTQPAEQHQK